MKKLRHLRLATMIMMIDFPFSPLFVCLTGRPCGTRLGPGIRPDSQAKAQAVLAMK